MTRFIDKLALPSNFNLLRWFDDQTSTVDGFAFIYSLVWIYIYMYINSAFTGIWNWYSIIGFYASLMPGAWIGSNALISLGPALPHLSLYSRRSCKEIHDLYIYIIYYIYFLYYGNDLRIRLRNAISVIQLAAWNYSERAVARIGWRIERIAWPRAINNFAQFIAILRVIAW